MFESIILGPGGIKGFLELGSLYYLEKNGHLNNIKTYIGVSIGSLLALLLSANFSVLDILLEFLDIDVEKKDFKILSLSVDFGILDLDKIRIKIEEMLINKWGKALTLKELYECTGIKYISVATNNTTKSSELISKDTFPDMKCSTAALASMTIPLIFKKIKYKGVLYTDGAISLPYPSLLFDNGIDNILCIHIYNDNYKVDDLLHYIYNNINIITNQMKNIAVNKASDKCKFIFLNSKIIDILGTSIDTEGKIRMFLEGYENTFIP